MRRSPSVFAFLAFVGAATMFAAPASQQASRGVAGEPQPIVVDFTAVMRDGTPVVDLKAADLALRIDGKARAIKTLEFIRFAGTGMTAGREPVVPAFVTNSAPEAVRSFVLIVDDESVPIGQEHKLREAMSRWIQELPSSDRVALVTVPNGGIKVDLTTDRERLRKGISEITPITPVVDAACRARSTLVTLRNTYETFGRMTGQPVVAVFFSATMVGASEMERAAIPNASSGRGGLSLAGGACAVQYEDFKQVGQAAAEAHVITYVMHPDFNPAPATAGIENLRSVTGAPLLHLSGTAGVPGLSRLATEVAGYYKLTFETEAGERLGVVHQIDVRAVARRDVDLRVRPQVMLTTSRPSAADTPLASFSNAMELIRSGRSFHDLPLRATSSLARGKDDAINVIALFDTADTNAKLASAAAALFDAQGRGLAYWTSQPSDLTGMLNIVGLLVPKGRYRLRIGAIDAAGRYGVIDDTITAELTPAGSLTMSGLSLGVSRSDGFKPRLQFSTEASALAHLELYGGVAGTPVGAVFEISETTDGPALFRVPGAISPTPDEDRFTVTGAIPVGMLPPGSYVIRAIVGAQGSPAGRVLRTLQKIG